ncbi:TetR family transcriptional regulator [Kribbella orskensis]|uniref:TetR family transcriptional regulator n=1 Tax=Kribbella orskensis TaxID=2512216 RepID=A0ABY2BCA2_9ACTN|nr:MULTISPECIES: TetR/AcrR family transcriptional regulator [Kribbella]TCN35033.1 TetR family transcriptional regulator [Kribbella sp. VKM Ac-2500]TCO16400.1 TetR family transcriptional regulator [Kribbella orskensis]
MPKVSDEHRLARRQQIVAAARTCVAEQGFHKTTMADVIRASGLSAGAVYGYFKSKDEIVAAIADDALSSVDRLFEEILAREEPLTPLAALEAAVEHVAFVAGQAGGDVTKVGIQAWAEALHNDAIKAIASEKYRMLRGHFVEVARRAQADGTVDPDTDPEYIAQVLFGLIPGFILQRLILGDVTPQTYTAGLAALLPR